MEKEQINLGEMRKEINALKEQMDRMQKTIAEDLEFAVRTELAWQEVDEGKVKTYSKDEFLEKLNKW